MHIICGVKRITKQIIQIKRIENGGQGISCAISNIKRENPIKKDEDNTEMLMFGELYSLDKILKKQKK